MTGNADSGKIATEKDPRKLVFTKLELSPVFLESPVKEIPPFPPISRYCSSFSSNFHYICFSFE